MDTKIIQNSDNISTELAKNSKKPIERKAADISDWLEIQVSIVKGISPKIIAKKTLREIVQELKRTDQKALNFATKLRNLYDQDKTGYSKEKEKNCPGFIVGDFSYRNSTGINTFIPLQVFDIDHVGDSLQVSFILEELKKLPYVFLAYPSPSGHGLRIMVKTDCSISSFKDYYITICNNLSEALKIPLREKDQAGTNIDTGTKDINRCWFYIPVDHADIYLNEDSQVFTLPVVLETFETTGTPETMRSDQAVITQGITTDQAKPKSNTGKVTLSKAEQYEFFKEKIEANPEVGKIVPGNRGGKPVYLLACELAKHSFSIIEAESFLSEFLDSKFNDIELRKNVKNAFKKAKVEFTEAQAINYILKYKKASSGGNNEQSITDYTFKPEILRVKPKDVIEGIDDIDKKVIKIDIIERYLNREYDLRYNSISNEVEISSKGKNQYKALNENDILCELLRYGLTGVEKPLLALLSSSFPTNYNPIQEYFDSLEKWNIGDFDHIEYLASFVKAKDQYWFKTQFKKTLIRCVACTLGFIPFNKQCFTLVGKQNDGKTSFIRFLCPPPLKNYIQENLEVNNKDGRFALCQNFIINLDELATFSKQDINTIKTYFTIETVKDRLPFGKRPIPFKRIANFFGSTNNEDFLTDETGNVRWLIFKIDGVNHDDGGKNGYNKLVDINKVWAQAYSLFKMGEKFLLSPAELELSEQNNQGFKKTYQEIELIQEYFAPAKKDEPDSVFMTTTHIKEAIELGYSNRKLTIPMIAKALRELGFVRCAKHDTRTQQAIRGFYVFELKKNSI